MPVKSGLRSCGGLLFGGIAYRNGWINEERMREMAQPMLKNQYGQYLLKVIDEMREETNSDFFRNKGLGNQ